MSGVFQRSGPDRTVGPIVGDTSQGPKVEVSSNGPLATDNNRWAGATCYKCGQVGHIRTYFPSTWPDLRINPVSIRPRNNENSNIGVVARGVRKIKITVPQIIGAIRKYGNKAASPIGIKPVKLGADYLGYSKLPKTD
jgi:hypothetical protein